ncbi:zinc finger domain-containing protein, partial [Agathobacter sp.]|uniref:zinc finger domain-containing protein n=1 Tax=Agathobacter sp. TaxID=2021311 RepID=UPI003AF188D0
DGPQGFGGGAGGPFGGQGGYYSYNGSGFDGFGDFGDLGDIFSSIFGGGFGGRGASAKQRGPRKGADLNVRMEITFEQAFSGVEKEIVITRDEECHICHGSGAKPGTSPVKCPTCHGTGQVTQVQNTILGQMQTSRTCSSCHGTGEIINEPCAIHSLLASLPHQVTLKHFIALYRSPAICTLADKPYQADDK